MILFIEAPQTVRRYLLDIPASKLKAKIRQEFDKHRHIQDLKVIDILLFKGKLELNETQHLWKQKTHVMRYFDQTYANTSNSMDRTFESEIDESFMNRFLQGK